MTIRHPSSQADPSSQYMLESKTRSFQNGRNPVVLIVEDQASSASVLALTFRQEGYVVYLASTIQQALSLAEQNACDVVLTNLHLPDGSGSDMMSVLRERYQLRGIAMTGDDAVGDGKDPRAQGFAYTLIKPLDFADLLACVRNVLLTTS